MPDDSQEFTQIMEDWDEDGIDGQEELSDEDQPSQDPDDDDDLDEEDDDSQHPTSGTLPEAPCSIHVRQGDCLASLAAHYGLPVDRIWQCPENAELRDTRDAQVLHPGDELYIPERELASVTAQSEQRHRFILHQPKTILRLRLLEDGEPRSNRDYVLEIEGSEPINGTTDDDGCLEEEIPADAPQGWIRIAPAEDDEDEERLPIHLGELDPIESVSGIQARLHNLGLYSGAIDDDLGARTQSAIARFQEQNDLTVTGELDDTTTQRIEEVHRS